MSSDSGRRMGYKTYKLSYPFNGGYKSYRCDFGQKHLTLIMQDGLRILVIGTERILLTTNSWVYPLTFRL